MGQLHFGVRKITNMNLFISILLLIASSCLADRSDRSKISDSSDNSVTNERNKKLFSLFTIVNFPNDQCTAKSDNTLYGTCYTALECTSKGGTADGNCAAGFGACCTFTLSTCGTTVSQNITYIQNPSYPTGYTTTGTCTFSVTPLNTNICQLRLDFDNFDIVETTAGVCTDSLTIAGPTGRNPMDLCGTLTGLHVYFEQGRSTTSTTLTFTTASTSGITWKAKVTQIECSSLARADPDCNQWFTGISGTVQSYNWPTIQLTSKTHNICIRREAGYCAIQYQAYSATSPDSFVLDDLAITAANGVAQGATTAVHGYLLIPGGPGATDLHSGGILCDAMALACGGTAIGVSGAIFREGHTFVLTHGVTATNAVGSLGFKLSYIQLPCGTTLGYTTTDL